MIKKITLLLILLSFSTYCQVTTNEGSYSTFASRSFVKFNRFLSIPTYSLLHQEDIAVSALVRNSHIQFEDAPSLYMFTTSGMLREDIGVGAAIYQQEVGIFKDLGFVANFAKQVTMNNDSKLTFAMNLAYSRRSAIAHRVFTDVVDKTLQNYQTVPIVILQPALTYSFGLVDVGLNFENLVDYNMKSGKMVTAFSDKIFGLHLGYSYVMEERKSLLSGAAFRVLAIAKKQPGKFGFGANMIADLPRIGWIKVAYDNIFGIEAGLGVNVTDQISVGFNYGKSYLGATNEIGIIYNIGQKSNSRVRRVKRRKTTGTKKTGTYVPRVKKMDPAVKRKIDGLQRKVDEVLSILKSQKQTAVVAPPKPTVQPTQPVTETVAKTNVEEKDTSLPRSTAKPWRDKYVEVKDTSSGGGGGTLYYVCLYQFKDIKKVRRKMEIYKKRNIDVRYVYNPRNKLYFIYIDRYYKAKKAKDQVKEINGKAPKKLESGRKKKDPFAKFRKTLKDPVFVEKITFDKGTTTTYKKEKVQKPAKVYKMAVDGVESGYYIRVSVSGSKPHADKFIDELTADGFKAGYFKKDGRRHIYIYKTTSKSDALKMYNNNMNNKYFDDKTIVFVQ